MGRPDQKRNTDGTYTFDSRKQGLPSTSKTIKTLYPEDDAVADRIRDAADPDTAATAMAGYAGDENPDVRDAAFDNPSRGTLYAQTEETCKRLTLKTGRLSKNDLAQLTPQAQEYLQLHRRIRRASRKESIPLWQAQRDMVRQEHLNDDTFILMAQTGEAESLAGGNDIDSYRAKTLLRTQYLQKPYGVPEILAGNRNLRASAWDELESRPLSSRSMQELAANPMYPADRANRLAKDWCSTVDKIKDPDREVYRPRVGKLLLDRDDLTDENLKRVMESNRKWARYAEYHNMRNESFAQERRYMGLAAGDYDPDDPPEDM